MWFQTRWPGSWAEVDISSKELVTVMIAAAINYGERMVICFHSGNMAVVAVLTSKTAKSPLLAHFLRCFSFFYSFHFSAKHVPGILNTAADALPRNKLLLSLP